MTKNENSKNWFVRLFTLGKKFSSKTFSDNFKTLMLNGFGLFVIVTFTFYVENLGEEYETKQKYIDILKTVDAGLEGVLLYSKAYEEETVWVEEMYKKQFDKWEIDNDSIYIDFMEDEEEFNGKYFFSPMTFFTNRSIFDPPTMGFDIWESGNQDFKLVDPYASSIISKIMKGDELKNLKINTNQVEDNIVLEYEQILKNWSKEIDVSKYENNDFWIKNRKFIQNDGELKFLLYRRFQLWDNVRILVGDYSEEVKTDRRILDSIINIYDDEKYFLYWKIN